MSIISSLSQNLDSAFAIQQGWGAWLALIAAKLTPQKVIGVITLAAAADFTKELIWDKFTNEEIIEIENAYYEQFMTANGRTDTYYQIVRGIINKYYTKFLNNRQSIDISVKNIIDIINISPGNMNACNIIKPASSKFISIFINSSTKLFFINSFAISDPPSQ